MFATELELGDAARDHRAVRWWPSCFRGIRNVLPGGRDGRVVVIHRAAGQPDASRAQGRAERVLDGRRPATG